MTGCSGSKTWRAVQLGSLLLAAGWIVAWCAGGGRAWGAALGAVAVLGAPVWLLAAQGVWAYLRLRRGGWRTVPLRVRLRAAAAELGWNLRVFAWQQPWRAGACPDTSDRVAGRGVLLVHGHLCTRAFWLPWLRWLRERGVPYATVELWPPWESIDAAAPRIDAALRRLVRLTGQPPLVLAHSKGGLAVRAWRRWALACGEAAPEQRVQAVVTVGTPHQGTLLADAATDALTGQMRHGGAWLAALAASEPPAWRARFVCVVSEADSVVYPADWALLPGAVQCRVAACAHIELAFSEPVRQWVWRLLAAPAGRPPW